MTPGRYPLRVYRGDSYEWRVVIWNDSIRTQPLDLAGFDVKAETREQTGARPAWPPANMANVENGYRLWTLPAIAT